MFQLFGLTPETANASFEVWRTVIHPEDLQKAEMNISNAVRDHQTLFNEYRIVLPDGAFRWIAAYGDTVYDSRDQPLRMTGLCLDITAAKRNEELLRDSETRFRTIFELIADAIVLHRGGKLIFVNPAAVAMFGAKAESELLGKPVQELIYPDDLPVVQARIKSALETGEMVAPLEGRYRKLDGTVFHAEAQGQAIVLQGVPTVLSTLRDITERKGVQAKLLLAASVFEHSREGITITDALGTILDVNEAFTRITGYRPDEAIGQNPRVLKSGHQDQAFYGAMWRDLTQQGHWSGEIWNRRKGGEVYAELLTISAVRDGQGNTQQYVALFSDITALKQHQNQLELR